MKNYKLTIIVSMIILLLACLNINPASRNCDQAMIEESYTETNTDSKSEAEEEDGGKEGPEMEQEYFSQWHEPYGNILEHDHLNSIWNDVRSVPSESQMQNPTTNSWACVGPYGMNVVSTGARYTGRILDIDLLNSYPQFQFDFRIAAASGGVWALITIPLPGIPVCISNNDITSQSISAVTTHPFNTNIIFVGTGESQQRAGTGMWKTSNGGTNWEHVTMSPEPGAFYRIKFNPGNPTRMHAATNYGYYRSDNSGITWTRYFTGNITDIAIRPDAPDYMYITKNGDNATGGVYQSGNGGTTWTKLTNGIPSTNVGRSSIAIAKSNPNVVYTCLGRFDNSELLGVYSSATNGSVWTNITPSSSIGGNAWYNNVIAVSPVNANIVLVGMSQMARTTNGGNSWSIINDDNLHVDHHALTWRNGGDTVYSGNDGGLSRSVNNGLTWTNTYNNYGITQFYNFDVGQNDTRVIFGGSQDNGILGATNFNSSGGNWQHTIGGDGAGVSIDYTDASRIWAVNGVYGGSIPFFRQKSNNYGQSWSTFNNGISSDVNWAPKIRQDKQSPFYLYTNVEKHVYRSASPYTSWSSLNSTAFNYDVNNVTVTNGGVVYACLQSSASNGLMVYDGGTWYSRTSGFPTSVGVRTVVHRSYGFPLVTNYSFALMNGFADGQKVFKTTNKGVTWTNISGNLPDVPMGDLVPHPSNPNILYAGTEFGCYRTTNGGTSWQRWNNGMPEANIVTEMNYIDSMSTAGKFYVLAATFGRSIWMREISGDDPMTGLGHNNETPTEYSLEQNFPNPFNPSTTIKYSLVKPANVKLIVFDITGKEVYKMVNEQQKQGKYEVQWNAANFSSGVYFYKLTVEGEENFTDVKKMMLVK